MLQSLITQIKGQVMDETLDKIWNQNKDHMKVRTLEARAYGPEMGVVKAAKCQWPMLV